MGGLSSERYHLFPFIAVQVIQSARDGDAAAQDVIRWAGEELGWLAVSVARQIAMENDEVQVIQSGSIFEAGKIITEPMKDIVLQHCPKAKMIRLDGAPVVGAVILGMEAAGFDGYAVRNEMVRTAKLVIGN